MQFAVFTFNELTNVTDYTIYTKNGSSPGGQNVNEESAKAIQFDLHESKNISDRIDSLSWSTKSKRLAIVTRFGQNIVAHWSTKSKTFEIQTRGSLLERAGFSTLRNRNCKVKWVDKTNTLFQMCLNFQEMEGPFESILLFSWKFGDGSLPPIPSYVKFQVPAVRVVDADFAVLSETSIYLFLSPTISKFSLTKQVYQATLQTILF